MMYLEEEQKDEILASLGVALIAVQSLELLIAKVLQYILPGETSGKTAEEIAAGLSKQTLGQLIRTLEKRAEINSDLVSALTDFIEERNILAHRLRDVAGKRYERAEQLLPFANRVAYNANTLSRIFQDLLYG